jgi:Xaa-Pro aminopeptidase
MKDAQRGQLIADAIGRAGYTALICRLPQDLVLLTGYQPILGNSFCVLTLDPSGAPEVRLAVPADERDLVPADSAVDVVTYSEETMSRISTTIPSVREPLAELLRAAALGDGSPIVGIEGSGSPVAGYYTQIGTPGPLTLDLIRELLPNAQLRDATGLLDALAATKTAAELSWIRVAEAVAAEGFAAAREAIGSGHSEAEVHAATYGALIRSGYASPGVWHVAAHVHVMSGPRAAEAYKAFNLTSNRTLARGDTVSVQMEVAVNGYWAELTRPFFAGEISEQWRDALDACIRAQDAAFYVIQDGMTGRDVDAAARLVMTDAGYGGAFKHGLGHGFGFQAINHAAEPVLHPASESIVRAGMAHNMEPAVYLDGIGGIRLNDNVLVTADGPERLSSAIPRTLDWLLVPDAQ